MALETWDRYRHTLSSYIDALETARKALGDDEGVTPSIRRLAAALEGSSGRHGYAGLEAAARAVHQAGNADIPAAVDRLLYTLLNTVADPGARDRTVLILDNDPVVGRVYRRMLEHANRRLKTAERAADMLAIFRTQWVDLVILEIDLPDLDGREVLAALRKNPITSRIPIIVTSARTDPWVRDECLALGADHFLGKPVDPVALADLVGDLLAPQPEPPPPEQPQAERSRVATRPRSNEILLAEHDPLTAQIIRQRLGREGLSVRHFASGTAALQAAKGLMPAAVIVDAMTPGIDGIELLGRLRELDHYRGVPIVVLSDIGSERDVVRALAAGADDCLRKPFSPTELVARVGRLLNR